jgi:hypothetical protein
LFYVNPSAFASKALGNPVGEKPALKGRQDLGKRANYIVLHQTEYSKIQDT